MVYAVAEEPFTSSQPAPIRSMSIIIWFVWNIHIYFYRWSGLWMMGFRKTEIHWYYLQPKPTGQIHETERCLALFKSSLHYTQFPQSLTGSKDT
ncbi:hypothetical protein BJX70DRAFT_379889 [Aspergillus crustosus]